VSEVAPAPGPAQNTTETEPFVYRPYSGPKAPLRLKKSSRPSSLVAREPKPLKKRAAEAVDGGDSVGGGEGLVSEASAKRTKTGRIVHLPQRCKE